MPPTGAAGLLNVSAQFVREPVSMRFNDASMPASDVVTAAALVAQAQAALVADAATAAAAPELKLLPSAAVAVAGSAEAAALLAGARVVAVVGSLVDSPGPWLEQLRAAAAAPDGLQAVLAVSSTASATGAVWARLLSEQPQLHLYATGLDFQHRRAHLMPVGLPEASTGWLPLQARQAWANAQRPPRSRVGDDTSAVVLHTAAAPSKEWPETDSKWERVPRLVVAADESGRGRADTAIAALGSSAFAAIVWSAGKPAPASLWAALYAGAVPVLADSAGARQLAAECPGLDAVLVREGELPDLGGESVRLGLTDPRRDLPWLRLSWWRNRIAAHLDGNPRPPLVWVHIGQAWPAHLTNSIRQAGMWNPGARRVLVTQRKFEDQAPAGDSWGPVELVAVEDLEPSAAWCDFQSTAMDKSKEAFRAGFWRYTTERLMALEAWAQASGTEELLHLENDNMLYADARELRPMARAWGVGVWVGTFKAHRREAVTNFVFVVRKQGLSDLVDAVAYPPPPEQVGAAANVFNEMQRAGLWLRRAPAGAVGVYPPGERRQGWPGKVDGAGFGQWVGGNDPQNKGTAAKQGFCNSWTYFPCGELEFSWGSHRLAAQSLAFPQYRSAREGADGEAVAMVNLHAHNKGRTARLLSDLGADALLPLEHITQSERW
ncbi:hypothetical protein FNF31_06028 [Cafeteria roenbergensis]|uniref:Uncharacterized protein n=1 Tax=Cafeteria roenbergensis TaxID=33653 RepID=A0A5A8CRY0_CAFRO|nr:hypothetical protein FNF31_06028 [Cafeteria roenbergensis]